LRIFDRQPVGLDLKHRLHANIGCGTWLRSRVALPPKGIFWALKPEGDGAAGDSREIAVR